jgi:ABC-type multidrug transport system ATPase subunit
MSKEVQLDIKSKTSANKTLLEKTSLASVNFGNLIRRNEQDYTLSFDDVKVSVSVPWWMPEFATPGVPGQTKQILKGVSGSVRTGQVMAIIGASGSGKTTLLDRLAHVQMMSGGVQEGSIQVNGADVTDVFFKARCAYMYQDDRLWGALTVYENLDLAAQLYDPNLTPEMRDNKIKQVCEAMGLLSCMQTKVGNVLIKGVSGGQRRRVSIAVELMGSASILFLDEPTSGLDSKSAAEIMQLLTFLAKEKNMLIVCSVHQPSTRTFMAFDRCLLLSKGKVAYFGPADTALDYMEKLGHKAPSQMNPADFLIEKSNPDFTSPEKVDELIAKWDATWALESKSRQQEAKGQSGADRDSSLALYSASLPWQVYVLMKRTFKSYTRDPGAYIGRAVLYTTMSIIFGIIYVGARSKNQENVFNMLFAIAWGMATPSYMAVMIMPVFSYEFATYAKEAKNGMYAPLAYTLASSIVQLLFVFVTSAMSVIPYYWIDDLHNDGAVFMKFMLMQYSFLYTIEGLCITFASFIPNFVISLGVVVSLLSNFFVFNGLFVTPDDVPWIFRWLQYVSPHFYTTQGLCYLAFHDQNFGGLDTCGTVCYGENGDRILDNVQGLSSDVNIGLMFGVLWIMTVVLRMGHWLVIRQGV